MSHFVTISSVCGDKQTEIDLFDLEENPFGVVCCERCRMMLDVLEGGK